MQLTTLIYFHTSFAVEIKYACTLVELERFRKRELTSTYNTVAYIKISLSQNINGNKGPAISFHVFPRMSAHISVEIYKSPNSV